MTPQKFSQTASIYLYTTDQGGSLLRPCKCIQQGGCIYLFALNISISKAPETFLRTYIFRHQIFLCADFRKATVNPAQTALRAHQAGNGLSPGSEPKQLNILLF